VVVEHVVVVVVAWFRCFHFQEQHLQQLIAAAVAVVVVAEVAVAAEVPCNIEKFQIVHHTSAEDIDSKEHIH